MDGGSNVGLDLDLNNEITCISSQPKWDEGFYKCLLDTYVCHSQLHVLKLPLQKTS
jgi:hypothetical protein